MSQPGPWVRALREAAAQMLSKNMNCATPAQGTAKRRLSVHFTLHSSHFTLHTSHLHFTLHTSSHLKACELFSPHLSSSHLIPSLLTCHQSKFNCFHLIRALINLSHLLEVVLSSSQLFCTPESPYCQRERDVSCKKNFGRRKFLRTDN